MFLGCRYDVAHIINKHHLSIRNFYYLILCHIGIPFFICHKVGDELYLSYFIFSSHSIET